jgi:predicted metal-dependent hydrolase
MGDVEDLKQQVKELNDKLVFFENFFQKSQKDIIKQALEEFTNQQKKDSLKSEFDRKFRKNKKQIIKQKILETAKTNPLPLADLKYYIVDQLEYCSKASFYRYIEELKDVIEVRDNVVYLLEKAVV